MKKRTVLASVVVSAFLLAFVLTAGLHATAGDDYKVIKNAVRSSPGQDADRQGLRWLKIEVLAGNGKKAKAKISLPFSLVELMINACPEEKVTFDNGCRIDIRRVWNELKKAGPLALVEVEDDDEIVKIWFE